MLCSRGIISNERSMLIYCVWTLLVFIGNSGRPFVNIKLASFAAALRFSFSSWCMLSKVLGFSKYCSLWEGIVYLTESALVELRSIGVVEALEARAIDNGRVLERSIVHQMSIEGLKRKALN